MTDFLERFGRSSRARVADAKRQLSESALLEAVSRAPAAPALKLDRFDLIAELKRRSPAAGGLAESGFDRDVQLKAYAEAGAAAISVLTEPTEFRGSLSDLREAAQLVADYGCPVMRKDFLTAPYQLLEARASGAGGALLIVAMLSDSALDEMVACGLELGLFLLLEAFDERDLERIAAIARPFETGRLESSMRAGGSPAGAGAATASDSAPVLLAGLNCRNLRTLEVDFGRFEQLAPHLPAGLPGVAESGIGTVQEIEHVAGIGYRAALCGSALMRAGDPARTVEEFIAAGRASRGPSARAGASLGNRS